jgi:hypothetical protein
MQRSVSVFRTLADLVIVFGLAVCLPVGACASEATDRAALLQGVTEIVAPGGIPGDFVVFGEHAFTVLTGRTGRTHLPVFAAAHYGAGRVVTLGHEAFFGGPALKTLDNVRLTTNIAGWLAGGKATAGLRVGLQDQAGELREALTAAGCKALSLTTNDLPDALKRLDVLWLNQASLDGPANRLRVEAVRHWVQKGGGLAVTGPAWGWQEVNSGLDLARDQSGNRLVMPMGIAFAGGELDPTGKSGFLTDEPDRPLTRALSALEALEALANGGAQPTAEEMAQITVTLAEAVGALTSARPDFTRRVEKLCADRGGDSVATKQNPITTSTPFARLKATLDVQRWRHLPPEKITASPAATSFPGPVPAGAERVTQTLTVDTRVPEWHGLGLYAAPGEVVTVTLPPAAVGKGLAIRIGAHTDTLWHLDRWERFPEITLSRPLDAVRTQVASPFGGTLYLSVPQGCKLGDVSVTIANAVAAPRYVRGVTDVAEWKRTIRNAPGPWAELEGKLVILTVPSYAVRELEDPEALMAYWDDVMEHCYALYAAPKRDRPERYCVDRQISAGYMHSGYPIMTGDDVARTFCDLSILRGNSGIKCWGFYHEMGHNFQQPEWTWEAFGEVTNNLFSLYGTETLNGVKVGAHPAMTAAEILKREQTVAAAPGNAPYFEKDPWYPLTMFWLMRREFGWGPFTALFAEFRDLPEGDKPRTEMEKHDQFLVRFSKATGHNLTHYLDAWGVQTSDGARAAVANLPSWMPSDWP